MFTVNLTSADVVFLYLTTSANEKIRPKLETELKKGVRVVSHDYEIVGWKPEKVENFCENPQFGLSVAYALPVQETVASMVLREKIFSPFLFSFLGVAHNAVCSLAKHCRLEMHSMRLLLQTVQRSFKFSRMAQAR